MLRLNMDKPILYRHASLRSFEVGEHHVTRHYEYDILVLVYEGVLRFLEEGVLHEVGPGEYYIQRRGLFQDGAPPSDSPKYLYIHFRGEWSESGDQLPVSGRFDVSLLWPVMEKLASIAHGAHSYTERCREFYTILMRLKNANVHSGVARKIADYLEANYQKDISLEEIGSRFGFSKNHVINLFRREYGRTPFAYINELRIEHAAYLLEVTSRTVESIAYESGFRDYSYFYRQFSRKNGMSPVQWRRKEQ